MFHKLQKMLF